MTGSRFRSHRPIGWPLEVLLAAACAASDPADPPAGEAAAPAAPAVSASATTPAWSPDSLTAAIAVIAAEAGGEAGVAAIHVESGSRASWNGDRRFPMASVYKLPIGLEVLRQVDQGALSLGDSVTIRSEAFVGGASPLADSARGRAVTVTIDRLLGYMLTESDNTASDALLRAVGGPAAVERRLAELGIDGVDVSRYEAEIFAESRAARGMVEPPAGWGGDSADSRDTATPDGMAELLAVVVAGAGLADASRTLLLERLTATRLGPGRIRGLLPAETPVAHKTGTFGPVVNDVGIITLPDGGHVAIAVLTRGSGKSMAERERAIARIARAIYDAFSAPVAGSAPGAGVEPDAEAPPAP